MYVSQLATAVRPCVCVASMYVSIYRSMYIMDCSFGARFLLCSCHVNVAEGVSLRSNAVGSWLELARNLFGLFFSLQAMFLTTPWIIIYKASSAVLKISEYIFRCELFISNVDALIKLCACTHLTLAYLNLRFFHSPRRCCFAFAT